ncbi:glucose-6-phosphate dehydrogenase [Magnetofaba australis]|uniref:Glucose-6-phosphate 1-dehydrogenase n=1 Tax=Magnetofaba australis IT-1 TaxID=1434232 RepID=A0A1Y2K9R9_9PROT|nr:glucose-6-phosphate dehydrogenase [Magnetofaba australis]OSM07226.1 putative glucose-6-phosphate dehydrogenase [Magnetofaba australis IT-1]
MRQAQPAILALFGATGDLAKRKLIPALYDLHRKGALPRPFLILGLGRKPVSDADFAAQAGAALARFGAGGEELRDVEPFTRLFRYQQLDPADSQAYAALAERMATLWEESRMETRNALFYLALPPSLYAPTADGLHAVGLADQSDGWRRMIVEKPFGEDLASGVALNRNLLERFEERQIYRIDHYLGKETVQNILALRFANAIFEPVWNRSHISHLEVTAAETIGVEDRGGYFDGAGILRDMVQNHLLQVLATVTMEPPVAFDAAAVRNETAKVLQSLRPITAENIHEHVVRGQYLSANVRGDDLAAYRDEGGVAPESRTETFVAIRAHIDNWRWGGIPIYIRSGKRLPTRVTEVAVHFRQPPHQFFQRADGAAPGANRLIIRIQPDEGILVEFGLKTPAAGFQIQNVGMDFHYSDLGESPIPSAYERLLLDGLLGDATLFARSDAVEWGWRFVQPILDAWATDPEIPLYGYPAGTWGPPETKTLFKEGGEFRYPCRNLTTDGGYCAL